MPKTEAPRPNTILAHVLEGIKRGELTPQIRERFRYTEAQITPAVTTVNSKYLRRPSKEKERARREAIRYSRGGLSLPIEFFTEMGMAKPEMKEAIRAVFNIDPPDTKLQSRIDSARATRPLTQEEIRHIQSTASNKSDEAIVERTMLWLDAVALVLGTSGKKVPATRMEWLSLVDMYKNSGKISPEALHWRQMARRYKQKNQTLPTDWSEIRELRIAASRKRGMDKHHYWEKNGEAILRRREAAATIVPRVYPLALRRLPAWDIALITNIPQRQVETALSNMRSPKEKYHKVAKRKREEAVRDHSRALAGRKIGEARIANPRQQGLFNLVRKFQEAGLIANDLSIWEEIGLFYSQRGRQMPEEPADRIVLEMYLKALKAYISGDDQLVNVWREIEKGANKEALEPLAQEKVFVRVKAVSPWADGEDGKGLYTITGDKKRQHHTFSKDGEIVFDTSQLAIKRARMRSIQVAKGKKR